MPQQVYIHTGTYNTLIRAMEDRKIVQFVNDAVEEKLIRDGLKTSPRFETPQDTDAAREE